MEKKALEVEIMIKNIGSELTSPENMTWPNKGGQACKSKYSPHEDQSSIKNIHFREEDFGGLAFSKYSNSVFSLNHEAYKVLSSLKQRVPISDICKNLSLQKEEIERLLTKIYVG